MNAFDQLAQSMLGPAVPRALGGDLRTLLGNGGNKWRNGLASSGAGFALSHAAARRNARAAMQDSPHARAIVERSAGTIADGGLRLELAPMAEVLGITREAAAAWAREHEGRFHLWAQDKKQHRSETLNWYQSQDQWQLFRHRDNDQFVRFVYETDPQLQSPLQFEFLDPEQIRGDALTSTAGFNRDGTAADGIVRDSRGREVGYKTYTLEADGVTYKEHILPARYPGGRIAMLHGFRPEYAGQGRGYSRLAHALQEFENITDFGVSTLKKAIAQSSIVAFIEPSKDEDAVNPFQDILTTSGAGPAATLFGANPQAVPGIPVTPDLRAGVETCYQVPEATIDQPGSLIVGNLTKGSSIKFPANTAPGDSYDKFVDAFAGNVAASLNIPLEVVLMKFGQNYSASRATLLLFWRVCCIEREEMATDYLNPTVEMWLSCEIAAGRTIAPGWSDPRMRAAWCNCNWIGSGPPDIDPAKSAKARQQNLELGVTNIEREARDHNGTSAADNIAKNNAAYAPYKPLPWNEPGNPPPGTPAAATGRAMAAFLDEVRAAVREELDS